MALAFTVKPKTSNTVTIPAIFLLVMGGDVVCLIGDQSRLSFLVDVAAAPPNEKATFDLPSRETFFEGATWM